MHESQVHAQIGDEGFSRLVRRFYELVPGDPVLGPMYPSDDLDGAEARLRDFLIYRFGGSQKYIQERGHPRLRMRHAHFKIDQDARDRWVAIMDRALDDAGFEPEVVGVLRPFLHNTATFMMNG